jgi:hypothetical protein
MPTESGDNKLLGNFRQLIDFVSADPNYKPANPATTTTGLENLFTASQAGVADLGAKSAPYKVAVNECQTEFEALPGVMSSSRNMAKASGADRKTQDDLETYVRKVIGTRKSKKVKDDPNTPENEVAANHSDSQLSRENQLGNFETYTALLENITSYQPNEEELKVSSLQTRANRLRAKHEAVSATFVPLSQARGKRDQLLYLNADCVVNTALLVKAYVKAAFGTQSQLYKSIKGLEFHRQGKRGGSAVEQLCRLMWTHNLPGHQTAQPAARVATCTAKVVTCTAKVLTRITKVVTCTAKGITYEAKVFTCITKGRYPLGQSRYLLGQSRYLHSQGH